MRSIFRNPGLLPGAPPGARSTQSDGRAARSIPGAVVAVYPARASAAPPDRPSAGQARATPPRGFGGSPEASEKPGDHAVLVHVDPLGVRRFRKPGHGQDVAG